MPPDAPRSDPARHVLLFVLVVLSGFLNLVSRSWGPAFRLNLILHPLLATFVTVTLVRNVFARLRQEVPGLGPFTGLAFVAVFFLALLRVFALKHLPIEVSNRVAGQILIPLFVLVVFLVLRAIPLLGGVLRPRTVLKQVGTLVVWTLTASLGALILPARGRPTERMIFDFHTVLGVGATVVGWIVLVAPARRALGWRAVSRRVALGLALFAGVGLAVDVAARRATDRQRFPSVDFHLATVPFERRASDERAPAARGVGAAWMDISRSCGDGDGCHGGVLDEARHSLHGVSYQPGHMQRVLDLVDSELGAANEGVCAGCHLPAALLAEGAPRGRAGERDALPCVFCHSVTDAQVLDSQRSRYTVTLDRALLAPFRDAEARGGPIASAERFLLSLNPRAHGRAFTPPAIREDGFCLSCHHGALRTIAPGPSCVDCHMERSSDLGLEGRGRNHFFPGSNVASFEILGWPRFAELNARWSRSELFVRALEDLYAKGGRRDFRLGPERLGSFFYMTLDSELTAIDGERARLAVRTASTRMTHPFPASSLDIQETWLEVRVTGRDGSTLFASGGTGPDGELLEGTHTLGGRMLGPDGRPIEHYRIWDAASVTVDRELAPGGTIEDVFELRLPAAGERVLNVDAAWRYRKLGHAFWRWAYGPERPPPTLTVLRHFTQYDLDAPG